VRAWSVATGRQLWASGLAGWYPESIDPLGRYISVSSDDRIAFLDANTGLLVPNKEIQIGTCANTSFSADGRFLYAVIHAQARLLTIDVETCRVLDDVVFIKDTVPGGTPPTDEEIDLGRSIGEWIGSWDVPAVSIAGEECRIALSNENTTTYILKAQDGTWRLEYRLSGRIVGRERESNVIRAQTWSPDGRLLARAHHAGFVSLVEAKSWRVVQEFLHGRDTSRDRQAMVNGVAFSPDGYMLASIGGDHTLRIWRVPPFSQRGGT
jgi:WD40 repeat protein